jgi:hypothetical protein
VPNAALEYERKLSCTSGGAGKGLLEGSQLIEATKGGLLEVI